ncbi:cytochrome P450 [Nocardia jiangsuensis]|uniref:Cytochrome P450 n=1 Tax=Nocardia jiangsuensis TaxID=1691563 RepID=A0ABV8E092_9NOCA
MSASLWVRWMAMQGVPRAFLSVRALRGDPLARLLLGRAEPMERNLLFDRLRARGGLVRTPFVRVSADYEVCRSVLRDSRFGVTNPVGTGLPQPMPALMNWADPGIPNPVEPPSMLMVDEPDHARYRRAVAHSFTPRAIERLGDRVETITADLLAELTGDADLLTGYAARLPVAVMADLLGLPDHMHPHLLEWGDSAAVLLDIGVSWAAFRRAVASLRHLDRYLHEHIPRIRRGELGETVLDPMITDPTLSHREIAANAALLIDAGFETTVNLIGNGIVLLLENPGALARLRAEPALWPAAVEEILRLESPVQMTVRTAHRDVELAGERVAAGEMIILLLAGANRDPEIFADPCRFDITRPNAREHLGFGAGAHVCLGAALARIEGAAALRGLFERFPALRLAAPPERRGLVTLYGYRRLSADLGSPVRSPAPGA